MNGREYLGDTAVKYRFGMNGQEKDDEIYGKGNITTAEFWEYDARLGRRWNEDPVYFANPSQSPFSVLNNSPLIIVDFNGLIGGPVQKNKLAKDIASIDQPKLEVGTEAKIQIITIYIYSTLVKAWDNTGMPDANKVHETGGAIIRSKEGKISGHRVRKSVFAGSMNLMSSYWFIPKGSKLLGDFHTHPYSKRESKMFENFDGTGMPHSEGDYFATNRKSSRTGFVSLVYSGQGQVFALEVTDSKSFRKAKDIKLGILNTVFAEVTTMTKEKLKADPKLKYTEVWSSSMIGVLQKYKDKGVDFGFNLYNITLGGDNLNVKKVFDSKNK